MAKSAKTTDKDLGYRRIIKTMGRIQKGPSVTVGVHASAGKHKEELPDGTKVDSELTVADVATFNEFGTERIPERSFIRYTVKKHYAKYQRFLREQKNKIIAGTVTEERVLKILGELIKRDIQTEIRLGNIQPANSPKTIAIKGSSTPLIDTAQLMQSITSLYHASRGDKEVKE